MTGISPIQYSDFHACRTVVNCFLPFLFYPSAAFEVVHRTLPQQSSRSSTDRTSLKDRAERVVRAARRKPPISEYIRVRINLTEQSLHHCSGRRARSHRHRHAKIATSSKRNDTQRIVLLLRDKFSSQRRTYIRDKFVRVLYFTYVVSSESSLPGRFCFRKRCARCG